VLDPTRLTVAGYALGGNVALHASALDERIKSVAVFSGFTPFRTDYNNKTTGGLQRLCASS
jgi:cephalosporin-C deacetylase-like acetyl esterase